MKTLIIIPCCAKKYSGGQAHSNNLTFFEDHLKVNDLVNNRNNNIVNHPPEFRNQYMKAWDRYNGLIYRKLKENQALIDKCKSNNCLEIIIVSALYGVLNYETEINDYNLNMNTRGLATLWGNSISKSIKYYIKEKNVNNVYTFLPATYLKVTNYNGLLNPVVDGWAYGHHGANNVNNHVANNILKLLRELDCSNKN